MVRLFPTHRLLFLLIIISSVIIIFTHLNTQRSPTKQQLLPPTEVEVLLEELFNRETKLFNVQNIWNKLMHIWKGILVKFLHDACDLCHKDVYLSCYQSIDLDLYIHYINASFYPFNEEKRPIGMGLYYHFNLTRLRSLNNSILSTDVTPCDYFHMFQLMMYVQMILHEKQIQYFITKGTFIGSLRHHDVIPWDTDIDLFIPFSAVHSLKSSFKQVHLSPDNDNANNDTTDTDRSYNSPIYRKDLVLYQYRNVHRVTSFKIFSIRSSPVDRTLYRWPKIDIFPFQESRTHIFAYPRHTHNLGTMNYFLKTDVEPIHLRPLGPLLIPSPRHLQQSLKAMVKLGKSNIFDVCIGNTFLHRQNRVATDTWHIPCHILTTSYPFVKSDRRSSTGICTEMVVLTGQNQSLSLFKYQCDKHLPRTLQR